MIHKYTKMCFIKLYFVGALCILPTPAAQILEETGKTFAPRVFSEQELKGWDWNVQFAKKDLNGRYNEFVLSEDMGGPLTVILNVERENGPQKNPRYQLKATIINDDKEQIERQTNSTLQYQLSQTLPKGPWELLNSVKIDFSTLRCKPRLSWNFPGFGEASFTVVAVSNTDGFPITLKEAEYDNRNETLDKRTYIYLPIAGPDGVVIAKPEVHQIKHHLPEDMPPIPKGFFFYWASHNKLVPAGVEVNYTRVTDQEARDWSDGTKSPYSGVHKAFYFSLADALDTYWIDFPNGEEGNYTREGGDERPFDGFYFNNGSKQLLKGEHYTFRKVNQADKKFDVTLYIKLPYHLALEDGNIDVVQSLSVEGTNEGVYQYRAGQSTSGSGSHTVWDKIGPKISGEGRTLVIINPSGAPSLCPVPDVPTNAGSNNDALTPQQFMADLRYFPLLNKVHFQLDLMSEGKQAFYDALKQQQNLQHLTLSGLEKLSDNREGERMVSNILLSIDLKKLRSLKLSGNRMSSTGMTINEFSSLQTLMLNQNPIGENGLRGFLIGQYKSLTSLNLNSTQLYREGMEALFSICNKEKALPNLKKLYLRNNGIGRDASNPSGMFERLKITSHYWSDVTSYLRSGLKNLEYLDIRDNDFNYSDFSKKGYQAFLTLKKDQSKLRMPINLNPTQ